MSLNRITLQGRLTKDIEIRTTQKGNSVASFTVAWSETYKDKERRLFLPCVAWKNNAEFLSNYFSKGSELVVEGSLETRKWTDNNGNNRETIELLVDRVHFCGPKKDSEAAPPQDNGYEVVSDDDDLPF